MRIAIPSDDGVNMAAHTGRTLGFVIYEIADHKAVRLEYRRNSFTAHAKGEYADGNHSEGQSHHSHGELLDALADCQVMIARGMGPRLVNDLARRNIQVVFSDNDLVEELAALYASGQLTSTGQSRCDH